MTGIDIDKILQLSPSPAYVVDLGRLRHNLSILDDVQKRSGAKILLALKAFSMWSVFPIIRETLHGVCASSPWEARLGREEFGGEVHSFAAAFKESNVVELLSISDHLVFNSYNQLERYRPLWEKSVVSIGLRTNPEHSEGHTEIYDPCAANSRLGITCAEFAGRPLNGVEGLHFHTLCEQLFEPLERTARVFDEKFGKYLSGMKWLNMGGGHHITREGYDIDGLVELVKYFKGKYGLEVYLEPGEAIAIGTGILVGEVLDVVHNGMDIAILDVSATCHMPDILEMPYRPGLSGGF
ncbi:MAG: carboxynorspermidine decarboxylase, partial [Deltaproteobacteria bacterium]|nr:carboxynorspermidine decarboxylase [Deltaproteobacteria bacterium]